jgi:exodeoxyribonuclease VII large subunit
MKDGPYLNFIVKKLTRSDQFFYQLTGAVNSLILIHMEPFSFFESPLLSIGQLVRHLRDLLEQDEILQDVWVKGELSNFTRATSGHLYFTLKDSEAGMRCVMWKAQAQRMRFDLRDGLAVEAHGSLNVYEANGQVQLYIDSMRPAGEGALYQEFLRLKAKLEAEGLFDLEHKRPIPELPRIIGVVTSSTGAALQDILNTITRRYPLVQVVLAPTTVQGVDAPAGIVSSIRGLNQNVHPDVIIIARGGGSIEDLWGFNSEDVARAIFQSESPVISGVGHETDFTIADFVADLRAPTPTAAAELATPFTIADLATTLEKDASVLEDLMQEILSRNQQNLDALSSQVRRLSPAMQINMQRQKLDESSMRYERAGQTWLKTQKLKLEAYQGHLSSLDPTAVLRRGYAIVTREVDGIVVSLVEQVNRGESVQIRVRNGTISSTVEGTRQEEGNV